MPLATPQGTLDFKSVDTITFVGASSNTVIDTTTGSFGVGVDANGPTSNLHVVGDALITGNVSDLNIVSNVNMLHTSNTASIKLNSNVVTEFPRSKKLIKYPRVAMTSATTGGYTATASTVLGSGWELYRAFNTIAGGAEGWHDQGSTYSTGVYTGSNSVTPVTGSAVEGEWIQIQLPGKIKLEKVRLAPREAYTYRMPKDATILGSINGTDWYRVTSWSGQTYLSGNNYTTIYVDSEQYYNYYVLVVEALEAIAGGNSVNIGEWELYGIPEYDPEAHGVDVTVKSLPNVPNTDWLEVYYDAKNYTSGAVPDLSTNSFNGTLTNGASYNNSDGIGKFTFDGSNDYISGSIPSTFTGNQTYTFSTWIKPTSHPSSGFIGIFEAGTRSDDDSFGLYLNAGNIVHLAYGTNLATTTLAPVGQWTHITGTYTSGDRKVYANGVLLGQDTYSALTLAGTTLVVGANSGGTQPFTGSIANFRLFNRALTTDEIYQLYAYQKEYFGHGVLGMTLKAGRLGIGTTEPRAALDVRGDIYGGCPVYFQALYNANFSATAYNNGTSGALIPWNTLFEHKGGCFDTSTGLFTAPIDGVYRFGYSMRKQTGSYDTFWTYIQKNGAVMSAGGANTPGRVYVDGSAAVFASQTFILDLSTGDTIGILLAESDNSDTDARMSNSYNYFHGYYIGTGNGSFGSYAY